MDKKISKNLIKLTIGVFIVSVVWYFIKCQCVNFAVLTPSVIRDYMQGFGNFAVIVYVVAYALNTISIIPPIAILSLTAGLVFGKVWGALYLMMGAMIGTSATYFISRIFGRGLIESFLKGKFKQLDDALERKGFLTVLFFRAIPIIPYEVLNYACGLSKMKFRDYFLATFLGLIPGVIISAFFGGAIGNIESLKDLFSIEFVIALVLLGILIMIPAVYQYIKKKRKGRDG